MLTQKRLKEILSYNQKTGDFIWKIKKSRCNRIGDIAGCKDDGRGYRPISIDYKNYRAHRLAWFYMTGEWPIDEIDHKNGIRSDNSWKNLRQADRSMNTQNIRKANPFNSTGLLGVSKSRKKFAAQIDVNNKRIRLGLFATPQEAHAVYLKAKRKLHVGCTI